MYPDNSNLIHAAYVSVTQDYNVGKVRETFAINQLQNAGHKTFDSEKGDVHVNDFTFEIGGASKKETQLQEVKNGYLLSDGILTGWKKRIPLYLIGFLY